MKIITVTLNPAYDICYSVPDFRQFRENLANAVKIYSGGKGINVSRALLQNGYASIPYVLVGRENAEDFESDIRECGIEPRVFYVNGRIRENLTFHSEGIDETRIAVNNFRISPKDTVQILDSLKEEANDDSIIICSGKFPLGLSRHDIYGFVEELKKLTEYLVLDSSSLSAEDILTIKPWMIKPNEQETEALIGKVIKDKNELLTELEKLNKLGIANVFASLGAGGAVYSGVLGKCIISAPKITPVSTVGAGDSTIAGFVSAFTEKPELEYCVRRACAFGTAACLEPGPNPPLASKVNELEKLVCVTVFDT